MRNIAVLALSLLLASSAVAATAPDALVIGTGGELRLADSSGTVATSLGRPGQLGSCHRQYL